MEVCVAWDPPHPADLGSKPLTGDFLFDLKTGSIVTVRRINAALGNPVIPQGTTERQVASLRSSFDLAGDVPPVSIPLSSRGHAVRFRHRGRAKGGKTVLQAYCLQYDPRRRSKRSTLRGLSLTAPVSYLTHRFPLTSLAASLNFDSRMTYEYLDISWHSTRPIA